MVSDVAPDHYEIINHLQGDNQPPYGGTTDAGTLLCFACRLRLNHEVGSCNIRIQLAVERRSFAIRDNAFRLLVYMPKLKEVIRKIYPRCFFRNFSERSFASFAASAL